MNKKWPKRLLIAAIVLFLLWLTPLRFFLFPTLFFGRVVDQHGNPVVDANVSMSAAVLLGEGRKIEKKTDADGRFFYLGYCPFGLYVFTKKERYYEVYSLEDIKPGRYFSFFGGQPLGRNHTRYGNPAPFLLVDLGVMEPLEVRDSSRVPLPFNGSPKQLSLSKDKGDSSHMIEFRLWRDPVEGEENPTRKVAWRTEISVPNGGMIERGPDYVFEAPEGKYMPSVTYDFPVPVNGHNWRDRVNDQGYFVRFADGTYARIVFDISTYMGKGSLQLESWWNPKAGSRNLAAPRYP